MHGAEQRTGQIDSVKVIGLLFVDIVPMSTDEHSWFDTHPNSVHEIIILYKCVKYCTLHIWHLLKLMLCTFITTFVSSDEAAFLSLVASDMCDVVFILVSSNLPSSTQWLADVAAIFDSSKKREY